MREWHAMKTKTTGPVTTAQRLMHLELLIFPMIGARPVDAIKSAEILGMFKTTVASGTAYKAVRSREMCGGMSATPINPAGACATQHHHCHARERTAVVCCDVPLIIRPLGL